MQGIAASHGIGIGRAILWGEEGLFIPKYKIAPEKIQSEIVRFKTALKRTKKELLSLQSKVIKKLKSRDLDFFKMHILALDDPYLENEVIKQIIEEQKNAEWALHDFITQHIEALSNIDDTYLRERVSDLHDIARRIIHQLVKKRGRKVVKLHKEAVIVAVDLTPTDTAALDKEMIKGFATDQGGKTSHTAIIARAFEIPAVVGLQNITKKVNENDMLIIDGVNGVVVINPDEKTLKEYTVVRSVFIKYEEELQKISHLKPVTKDNHYFRLAGNIEIPDEIEQVISHGGEGIGLFRTEFLYLNTSVLPSEEKLFKTFKEAVEKVKPYHVIFRTLDIGGDKIGGNFDLTPEVNPFLGYRAIRFCLENVDIFKTHLRAMLRASNFGKAKIMFPMITSLDEIKRIKSILEEIKEELTKEGIPFDSNIEIGAMIEIPSAALIVDAIIKEVDFVSIGTNDLIQYTLAVDRTNPKISYIFDPFHPAILRLLKQVVDVCHEEKVPVHVCGEIASDPLAAIYFIGLHVDELSMSHPFIPEIKKLIRTLRYSDAKNLVEELIKYTSSIDIKLELQKFLKENSPEIYEKYFLQKQR